MIYKIVSHEIIFHSKKKYHFFFDLNLKFRNNSNF